MTDLRKAAEMALNALKTIQSSCREGRTAHAENEAAIIEYILRQALAQPEQEFVGACVTCGAPKSEWLVDAVNISQERVDETVKREYEPVAYEFIPNGELLYPHELERQPDADYVPLYTAPPKREWVGLTDEEKYDVLESSSGDGGRVYYDTLFRSYEAKLKEKNGD